MSAVASLLLCRRRASIPVVPMLRKVVPYSLDVGRNSVKCEGDRMRACRLPGIEVGDAVCLFTCTLLTWVHSSQHHPHSPTPPTEETLQDSDGYFAVLCNGAARAPRSLAQDTDKTVNDHDGLAALAALRGLALMAPVHSNAHAQEAAAALAGIVGRCVAGWPAHQISAANW